VHGGGSTVPCSGKRLAPGAGRQRFGADTDLARPLCRIPVSGWFLNDPMHLVVQGLVAFIGLVVARYCVHYLDGDPGQQRFQRWLQLTLGCVMVVATTNHLAVSSSPPGRVSA
jgi:hypothetical protein